MTNSSFNLASFNLTDINGSNGFVINGLTQGARLGSSLSSAGDINGDGIADLIIGAPGTGSNGYNSGASYVVFGGTNIGSNSSVDLSTLDGSNGFVINGLAEADYLGTSLSSAGDINNDGIADLIIGAPNANSNRFDSGASYVVFGGTNIGSNGSVNLSTLDGSNGFVINGIAAGDLLGRSVSSAGDLNNDGIADLIIGTPNANPNSNDSGASYVVFGGTNVGSNGSVNLSTLDGTNGFVINGLARGDRSGTSVSSAGDINNDGIADLIIGAPNADSNGSDSGASYVVFGGTNVGSNGSVNLSTLDGTNGFVIKGIAAGDVLGHSVSSAGDINGDGINDLIITAPLGYDFADPSGHSIGIFSGASYVVFGSSNVGSNGSVDLSTLDGTNGFVIKGLVANDHLATSVSSAGDINNDGIADLIIGASEVDATSFDSGATYVVFGSTTVGSNGNFNLENLDGSNGFVIDGLAAGDFLGGSVSSAGDLNNDGIADLIIGASGGDRNGIDSGASYVVFGSATPPLSPSALNDIATTTSNTAVSINVLANDSDPYANSVQIASFNATSTFGGSITLNDNGTPADFTDDQLVYNPIAGFSGLDSFSYTINNGNGGTDTTTVNVAVFTQIGTPDDDTLVGASTPEKIWGQAGNDLLTGGETSDWLRGGRGDDVLAGGDGIDTLRGGFGNDVLTGGGGSDRFVLKATQGTDAIADFEDGIDRIILTNGLSFGQLDISQSNSDTLISLTSTGEVLATLTGVSANLITSADFYTIY
jgi:hypothetical protein